MKRRSAFTLVEMLISMSVGATLMALAIGVVHRTMTVESAARAEQANHRAAAQLSRQFRRDVHRSNRAAIKNGGITLSVETATGATPTTYSFDEGAVTRKQVRGNGKRHVERYRFVPGVQFDIREEPDPRRIVLTVEQNVIARETPCVLLHCEAVLGRLPQSSTVGEK